MPQPLPGFLTPEALRPLSLQALSVAQESTTLSSMGWPERQLMLSLSLPTVGNISGEIENRIRKTSNHTARQTQVIRMQTALRMLLTTVLEKPEALVRATQAKCTLGFKGADQQRYPAQTMTTTACSTTKTNVPTKRERLCQLHNQSFGVKVAPFPPHKDNPNSHPGSKHKNMKTRTSRTTITIAILFAFLVQQLSTSLIVNHSHDELSNTPPVVGLVAYSSRLAQRVPFAVPVFCGTVLNPIFWLYFIVGGTVGYSLRPTANVNGYVRQDGTYVPSYNRRY